MSDINGFGKLITDMINDLLSVFPELDNDSLDSDIRLSITNDLESISRLNDYCSDQYGTVQMMKIEKLFGNISS
jgi:hypothetical protein